MKLTEEQRSMIASACVAGMVSCVRVQHGNIVSTKHVGCLCCSPDALKVCAVIVGKPHAGKLWDWIYGGLGCGGGCERDEREQSYLDKIADLDDL